MTIHTIIFVIIIIFFIQLFLFYLIPTENLDNSKHYIQSNDLIHVSKNNIHDRKYIIDNQERTFTKKELNVDILSRPKQKCVAPATYNSCTDSCICPNGVAYNNGCSQSGGGGGGDGGTTSTPSSTPTACPAGKTIDKKTNMCVSVCSQGEYFDPVINKCASDCSYAWSKWGYCDLNSKTMIRTVATKPPLNTGAVCTNPPPNSLSQSCLSNMDFHNDIMDWKIIYNPDTIIGIKGTGPKPSVVVKKAPDSYGFTFKSNYVQVEFAGFTQYPKSSPVATPTVTLQTNTHLAPGQYLLSYNIQTRPNYSLDNDKRTISIHTEVNKTIGETFNFSKKDEKGNYIPILPDETQLIPQVLLFNVSEAEAQSNTFINFVFTDNDPANTNDCTVAIGDIQLKNCSGANANCKINCTYGWNNWSTCDKSTGTQYRDPIIFIKSQNGGEICPTRQTRNCDIDCEIKGWGPWSDCDKSKGIHYRDPDVAVPPKNNGKPCPQRQIENCAVDCEVNGWGDWSSCNPNDGTHFRAPKVVVQPKNGGKACPANDVGDCAVNCDYVFVDSNWTTCDPVTGKQSRDPIIRTKAKKGGKECPTRKIQNCAVDCVYNWPNYGPCDKNTGTKSRDPNIITHPKNGGKACPTTDIQPCPVDCEGGWGSQLSNCKREFGCKRARKCNITVTAKNGGAACNCGKDGDVGATETSNCVGTSDVCSGINGGDRGGW